MAENRIRHLGWLASLALVGAGCLAACGDEDASDIVEPASVEASRGSDQHLYNLATDIDANSAVEGSDRHLDNQAAEIAEQQAQVASGAATHGGDGMPNPWEAGNRAAQEALDEESSNDEFVPGTRRMPAG